MAGEIHNTLRNEILEVAKHTYGTIPDYPWMGTPENAVLRHSDNRKWYALIMTISKKTLNLPGEGQMDVMNVKSDPELVSVLRGKNGYYPAYHMNKEKWITVALDGTVSLEEIMNLLSLSYELTKES